MYVLGPPVPAIVLSHQVINGQGPSDAATLLTSADLNHDGVLDLVLLDSSGTGYLELTFLSTNGLVLSTTQISAKTGGADIDIVNSFGPGLGIKLKRNKEKHP